jgi:hypothetical protein
MGLARHNPRGQLRLGLSATAGSAVLYSTIVVLGIGSASPSALDVDRDRHASVVLVPQHADTVPGSVRKLPQASPEPGRHRSRTRARQLRNGVPPAPRSAAPATVASPTPRSPRATESESPNVASSTPVSAADPAPVVLAPVVPVPAVTVPVLESPVPLPELPAPQPLPLPLP